MKKNTIGTSFSKSIRTSLEDPILDTSEIILDSFLNDGILKEIPILKYAVTALNIYDDIKGRHFLKKLNQFIFSFNSNLATDQDVERVKRKFSEGNQDEELTYITILLDRYLDEKKPEILAKLYMSYLDRVITWEYFSSFSEVIDKLLPKDILYLLNQREYVVHNNVIQPELLRLSGLGLMYDYQNDSPFETTDGGLQMNSVSFQRVEAKERVYSRTSFGQLLVDALE